MAFVWAAVYDQRHAKERLDPGALQALVLAAVNEEIAQGECELVQLQAAAVRWQRLRHGAARGV
jgi:hypothetical protein